MVIHNRFADHRSSIIRKPYSLDVDVTVGYACGGFRNGKRCGCSDDGAEIIGNHLKLSLFDCIHLRLPDSLDIRHDIAAGVSVALDLLSRETAHRKERGAAY